MKSTGSYPRVHVDTAKVTAVGQAGGILLTETIRAAGLDRALSEALSRWRKPLAVHDPGKIICDLAMSLVLGGEALSDLATLRAEPGVYGPVASDPTVSRLIAALAEDADKAIKAIAGAIDGLITARMHFAIAALSQGQAMGATANAIRPSAGPTRSRENTTCAAACPLSLR